MSAWGGGQSTAKMCIFYAFPKLINVLYFRDALAARGITTSLQVLPGLDHFDLVENLASEQSIPTIAFKKIISKGAWNNCGNVLNTLTTRCLNQTNLY